MTTRRSPLLALPLLLTPLLGGCPRDLPCTDLAAVSALIHVVDGDGNPLVTVVTAEDADGNDVPVSCAGADLDTCTDWLVGYEVDGEITIAAQASDGCNTATGFVTVDVPIDDEGCHVVQQEATVEVTEWTDLGCP